MWIRQEKEKIDQHIFNGDLTFDMMYYENDHPVKSKIEALMDYTEENGYKCLPVLGDTFPKGFKAVKVLKEDVNIIEDDGRV